MSSDAREPSRIRRWLPRIRLTGLVLATLAATAFFLWFVHDLYPIHKWLFWHYLQAWLLSALWAAACLSAGFGTLHLVLKNPLPIAEHVSIGFAIGVYEFFLGLFVGGLLRLYGGVFFYVLPLLLLAAGAWPSFRYLRRLRRHWRAARRRARPTPAWNWVAFGFGLLTLAMIYFTILSPENVSYDSRWQHLGLGEHYASAGGIRRSVEGSYLTTAPHLAATIYAWAMQMPFSMLFDRVTLAAHIELVGFLFTLAGVSAIARRLVPLPQPRNAWVVRFLFPGVLLYDSSLSVGADHIAAIFAAPIFLAMLRAWHDPAPRWLLVLVIALAGSAMTKYTGALLLIGFPVLLLALRFAIDSVRAFLRRPGASFRRVLLAIGTALAAGLILTAPHWLKNWAWYGDPIYPLLHKHLTLTPWTEDSAQRFDAFLKTQLWRPKASWSGLLESLKVLFTWAFIPNDWPQFHGKWPVFGALFSIGLVLLPFLRRARRVWLLYATVHFGIFLWYWIHHQDRYLQAIMPTIAGGTAAVLALAWRQHWTSKIALSALIASSIIWGGDVWFIQTHAVIGSPQKYTLELFFQGFKGKYDDRLQPYGGYAKVAKKLPRTAVVLLHDERMRLGLRTETVVDNIQGQGGISYGRYRSPQELYEAYRQMRLTHFLFYTNRSWAQDTLAGDFVFFDFALNVTLNQEPSDGFTLSVMPAVAPKTQWRDRALVLGCPASEYPTGLYRLEQLMLPTIVGGPPPPKPTPIRVPEAAGYAALANEVDFVAVDRRCQDASAIRGKPFKQAAKRLNLDLYVRTRVEPAPAP